MPSPGTTDPPSTFLRYPGLTLLTQSCLSTIAGLNVHYHVITVRIALCLRGSTDWRTAQKIWWWLLWLCGFLKSFSGHLQPSHIFSFLDYPAVLLNGCREEQSYLCIMHKCCTHAQFHIFHYSTWSMVTLHSAMVPCPTMLIVLAYNIIAWTQVFHPAWAFSVFGFFSYIELPFKPVYRDKRESINTIHFHHQLKDVPRLLSQ